MKVCRVECVYVFISVCVYLCVYVCVYACASEHVICDVHIIIL